MAKQEANKIGKVIFSVSITKDIKEKFVSYIEGSGQKQTFVIEKLMNEYLEKNK